MSSGRLRRCAAAALAVSAMGTAARADELNFPCDGCVVLGAVDGPPRPLLVVLHGDEGGPSRVVAAWRDTASKMGMTLFAPRCPRELGCVASYWQWDGDPAWLLNQVTQVAARYPVDPSRRYLGGWSGGSTYITFHPSSWFPTFAALSIAGGGAPGTDRACFRGAGGDCGPIHYVMGDGNPFFELAVRARDNARACGHEVSWNPLAGADHESEWRWYVAHTKEIATWLLAHSDGCRPAVLPLPSASALPALPPRDAVPPPPASYPNTAPHRAAAPLVPVSHCACTFAGSGGMPVAPTALGSLGAALCLRRRKARGAGPSRRRPSRKRSVSHFGDPPR